MNRTVLVGAVTVALGLLAIGAGFWYLQGRMKDYEARLERERAEEREALANDLAASRAATGKAYLASGDHDSALATLREARATRNATNLEPIDALIVQAEQGQADALLEKALSALRRRDAARGLRLLTAYRAHARANQKKRAERMAAQVRRATAKGHAVAVLRRLSDAQLDRLDAGKGPADERVTDALAKPIFVDTLRRHLPQERQRRAALLAAQRAEAERLARLRQQREKRVRESEPFKEMAELAAEVRKRYRTERALLDRQKRALTRLTGELNLGGEELARLRKSLVEGEKKALALKQAFTARRAAARKAYQAQDGVKAADLVVFDELLDRLAEGLVADKP